MRRKTDLDRIKTGIVVATIFEVRFRPCLHDTGLPVYRIPFHIGLGFSLYGPHESNTLCSNDPVQLCSASADGTKMDLVQSVPFCFACKHNPIRNGPKSRFGN